METIQTFQKFLLEKDNRKKIIKSVGLTADVAEKLRNIHTKYDLWLANKFKEDILKWPIEEFQRQFPDVAPDTFVGEKLNDLGLLNNFPFPVFVEDALNADWALDWQSLKGAYEYVSGNRSEENEQAMNNVAEKALAENEIDIRNAITGIIDWISNQHGQIDIRNYNFRDANTAQREWHQQAGETETLLQATGGIRVKTAEEGPDFKDQSVVLKYPDNWFWLDLGTNSSTEESTLMSRKDVDDPERDGSHCGTDSSARTLWSLRDGNRYIEVKGVEGNAPYLTIAVIPGDGQVTYTQFKGIGNRKPLPKFYERIVEMFIAKNVDTLKENSYQVKDNFHVQDLPSVLFKKLITAIPKWMEEPAVLMRAHREGMVGRDQVDHFINNIQDVSITDDKTIVYVSQRDISNLSNIVPIDNVLAYFMNNSYKENPGDFIYKLDWQNILPKEELYNAVKYFAVDYQGEETKRYVSDAINATYGTNANIQRMVDGIAEIIKKYNKPVLYVGYRLDKTPVELRDYYEDEFYKIEISTDNFYDFFIEYFTQKGSTGRSMKGVDVLSTSQNNLNTNVDAEMVINPIQNDVINLLRDQIIEVAQATQENTETFDFFGGDYEEEIDYNKKADNILKGIKYEQRSHRRRPRYNIH